MSGKSKRKQDDEEFVLSGDKALTGRRKSRRPVVTTRRQAKRLIRIVIGFTVVLIGIVGLFLPFLQGAVTIVLGLAILGTEFVWAKRLMKRFEDGANNLKNSIFGNSSKQVGPDSK